ncbi:MAG: hypothetical protein CVU34_16660 [Betaproteobacteria bacterium HGW-Betaproteobacteria-7]|nr:MAG: hypothetical protein CVU34_16660 [Betaproteobacteria bacterium HGW-Betaproteobacteria-7]
MHKNPFYRRACRVNLLQEVTHLRILKSWICRQLPKQIVCLSRVLEGSIESIPGLRDQRAYIDI